MKAFWQMKSGRIIRILDMDDQHLDNTIAMIRRRIEVLHSAIDDCRSYDEDDIAIPRLAQMAIESLDRLNVTLGVMMRERLRRCTEPAPPPVELESLEREDGSELWVKVTRESERDPDAYLDFDR